MNLFDRMFISMALTVSDVIESGQSAMSDGGAFAEQTGKIDQIGGGLYHVFFKGAIYIGLLCVIGAGVKLMISNANTRDEAKRSLFWTGLGMVIVAGAVIFVTLLADIGTGLAQDLSTTS